MRICVEVGELAVLEIMRREQARRLAAMSAQTPVQRAIDMVEIMHQLMDRRLALQDAAQGAGVFTREQLLPWRPNEPQQQG